MKNRSERLRELEDKLQESFLWPQTPQGASYWSRVYHELRKLELHFKDIELKESEEKGKQIMPQYESEMAGYAKAAFEKALQDTKTLVETPTKLSELTDMYSSYEVLDEVSAMPEKEDFDKDPW